MLRVQELPPGPVAPLLLRLLQDELAVDKGVRAAALRVFTKAMMAATSDVVCKASVLTLCSVHATARHRYSGRVSMPAVLLQLKFIVANHVFILARNSHCREMWCARKQAKEISRLMAPQGVELSVRLSCGAAWHSFWWVPEHARIHKAA